MVQKILTLFLLDLQTIMQKKLLMNYMIKYIKTLVSNLNLDEAEYTKLLVNAYLTLKISFSNMVKIITKNEKNLSLEKILKVVGSDSRIGSKYMRPGGPFSGPCLPRDVKALNFDAENKNYKNFIATASGKTNDQIIEFLKEDLLKFKEENFNSIIFSVLVINHTHHH